MSEEPCRYWTWQAISASLIGGGGGCNTNTTLRWVCLVRFAPELSRLGYEGHFIKKPHSPCLRTAPGSGLEDGCALFWKSDVVSVLHVEPMAYLPFTEWCESVGGCPSERWRGWGLGFVGVFGRVPTRGHCYAHRSGRAR